ncbi:hypothetical protein T484DRAFT_3102331 [Baffinella frigidus]|nr:hypothetical protein T484DRAFT_3102331 [Cryptophyta sp. CCMP2293]
MVRQVAPRNAKWMVRAAGDLSMSLQRKSELDAVLKRLSKNDPRLVDLSLSWTGIGDWGLEALSDVLKVNTVLTSLDLYHNDIGPRGAGALARALWRNYSLLNVNLDSNNIGDEGASDFIHTMEKHNSTLTVLKLTNNHVDQIKLRDLNDLLERNCAVKVDKDWHGVQNQILPLRHNHKELESDKVRLEKLPEADDPAIVEQRNAIEEEMTQIEGRIEGLLVQEEKLVEEGSWLKRNYVKLRNLVTLRSNVEKAVFRFRPKKWEHDGPTIEEQRTAINELVMEMQRRFLDPEANKWTAEYRRQMENELRNLMLEKARVRSLERMAMAQQQAARKVELAEKEVAKMGALAAAGPVDEIDKFKPRSTNSMFEVSRFQKMRSRIDRWGTTRTWGEGFKKHLLIPAEGRCWGCGAQTRTRRTSTTEKTSTGQTSCTESGPPARST